MMTITGLYSLTVYFFDRCSAQINQLHVTTIKRLEIMCIDGRSFGTVRMIYIAQAGRRLRVFYNRSYFVTDKRCCSIVGVAISQQVRKHRSEPETTSLPRLLIDSAPITFRRINGIARIYPPRMSIGIGVHHPLNLVSLRLQALLHIVSQRTVTRGNTVVGGALKHRQMSGTFCNNRGRLYARRSGADLPDAPTVKINPFVRPLPGVVPLTCEIIKAFDIRDICSRQTTNSGDQKPCTVAFAIVTVDQPPMVAWRKTRRLHASIKVYVRSQFETICHMIEVT